MAARRSALFYRTIAPALASLQSLTVTCELTTAFRTFSILLHIMLVTQTQLFILADLYLIDDLYNYCPIMMFVVRLL